jgi:phage terminase large subunit
MATAVDYSFYGGVKKAILCKDREMILSGPAETGKTLGLLWKLDVIARKYKNASIVLARKTLESTYSTVLVTFQKKILQPDDKPGTYVGGVQAYGGEKPQWFDYTSTGSRIWLAGMDKSSKVLSAEHDVIYVNQVEELSLPDWETLTTRTTGRAGNVSHPQTIGDCNPAAPTHWIRSRAASGKLTLIENTHFDNPVLFDPVTHKITKQGEQTFETLDALTGARYSRLRKGLWAAPEGAIYSTFDEEVHKVESFTIPPLWPRVVGIDPLGAYVVALWLALDPINRILNVYREYFEPFGAATPAHVRSILELSAGETIFAWIGGGPSERAARTDWTGAGIPLLEPSISDVWLGIDRVNRHLVDRSLVIHDCCTNLLSEIGSYVRKQSRDGVFEDKIVSKDRFHGLDALRYMVSWLTEPQETEEVMYSPIKIGNY